MGRDAQHIVRRILEEYSAFRHQERLENEVMDWLAGDRHEDEKDIAIREMFEQIMAGEGSLDENIPVPLDDLWKRISIREKPSLKRRLAWMRVAAVLMPFLLLAGILFYLTRSGSEPVQDAETDYITLLVGEDDQDYIRLPDGTEIWLNGSSEIRYSENFTEDRVVHLNGEAFFSVDGSSPVPFRVISKSITVTVKGTRFNVTAYDESDFTKVVLVEGEVEVTKNGTGAESVTISPNEQAVVDNGGNEIEVSPVESGYMPQWRRDMVVFDNSPMEEVLKVVAARSGYVLRIEGSLPADGITVSFAEDADIETAMYVVRQTSMNFDYEIRGQEIIVYSR